jgi:hypothetical protein
MVLQHARQLYKPEINCWKDDNIFGDEAGGTALSSVKNMFLYKLTNLKT